MPGRRTTKMNGTIICFGDSNTYGFDPTDFFESRFPEDKCWTGILNDQTPYLFENYGVCGRAIPYSDYQISYVCNQIARWSEKPSPVFLWIMLGTNDLLQYANTSAKAVADTMEYFLTRLMQTPAINSSTVKLRLISPPPLRSGEWTDARSISESEKLEGHYSALAKKLGIDFTGTAGWDIPLIYDGVHFTLEGHKKFAEEMIKFL